MAEDGGNRIALGELFNSYCEFEQELQKYEKGNFVQHWKRHSRSLDHARKRNRKYGDGVELAPELKYCEVDMNCVCGGRQRKSQAKEDGRPLQRLVWLLFANCLLPYIYH